MFLGRPNVLQSIFKYFIIAGCQWSDRGSWETKFKLNSNYVEERIFNYLISLTCQKLNECLRSFTVMSLGSFMVLFLVSVGIHKHIFTGCDAVVGCPTTESDSDCSNKELMNQQANVQSSLLFHTVALKVYAQMFWWILLVSDSCSRN